jgi:hypothetical protein
MSALFGPNVCAALERGNDLGSREFVYFVTTDVSRLTKIGRAQNVETRLKAIQTGNHEPLSLLGVLAGGKELEREIHAMLADTRVRGEWFRPSPALKDLLYAAFAAGTGRSIDEVLAA